MQKEIRVFLWSGARDYISKPLKYYHDMRESGIAHVLYDIVCCSVILHTTQNCVMRNRHVRVCYPSNRRLKVSRIKLRRANYISKQV